MAKLFQEDTMETIQNLLHFKKSYTVRKCHKQSKKPNDDQEIIFSIHERQSAIIPNIKKRTCNSKKILSTVEIWAKK